MRYCNQTFSANAEDFLSNLMLALWPFSFGYPVDIERCAPISWDFIWISGLMILMNAFLYMAVSLAFLSAYRVTPKATALPAFTIVCWWYIIFAGAL